MPSKLIERYKKTAPMCYKRLSNSVAGSAQACVGISNELNDVGMQISCMHPALNLLGTEFYAMYSALKDLQFVLDSPVCHGNVTKTIKCVQEVCHKVADQVRDIVQGSNIWSVVASDDINDRLHALAISLQEQQMTLELLTIVMASVDPNLDGPSVLHHYNYLRYEPEMNGFLDEVRKSVLSRREMKRDVLLLRTGRQQLENSELATASGEDTEVWSSTQSTTTAGIMTPTETGSDRSQQLAVGHDVDGAVEDLLRNAEWEFTQKDLARLVFHWTNIGAFGDFERHELTSSL